MFIYLLIFYLLNKRRGERNLKVNTSVSDVKGTERTFSSDSSCQGTYIQERPTPIYACILYTVHVGGM